MVSGCAGEICAAEPVFTICSAEEEQLPSGNDEYVEFEANEDAEVTGDARTNVGTMTELASSLGLRIGKRVAKCEHECYQYAKVRLNLE